jgi:hypothetical protein
MDPLDARVLNHIRSRVVTPKDRSTVSAELGISPDEFFVSIRNLTMIGTMIEPFSANPEVTLGTELTTFGRELLRVLMD